MPFDRLIKWLSGVVFKTANVPQQYAGLPNTDNAAYFICACVQMWHATNRSDVQIKLESTWFATSWQFSYHFSWWIDKPAAINMDRLLLSIYLYPIERMNYQLDGGKSCKTNRTQIQQQQHNTTLYSNQIFVYRSKSTGKEWQCGVVDSLIIIERSNKERAYSNQRYHIDRLSLHFSNDCKHSRLS